MPTPRGGPRTAAEAAKCGFYSLGMELLPLAPSCSLDKNGLRAQRDRYRRAGAGAQIVARDPRRITVRLAEGTDASEIEHLVEVERDCCPFFELAWAPEQRLLSVGVAVAGHEPALDAIVAALGLAAAPA
jgi:hypothetical protein